MHEHDAILYFNDAHDDITKILIMFKFWVVTNISSISVL